MKSVLITGGAGFIGCNLVRQWVEEAEEDFVVNLDKLTYAGNLDSLADVQNHPRYRFVYGDIGDPTLVSQLLAEFEPRVILNLAAESHVDRSIDRPNEFVQTNVVGTFRLLEATRSYWAQLPQERQKAFRFLHVSTDEVFGSLGSQGYFTETTPYSPNSPYSASKAASDHFVQAYHHTYGLPTLITNCSNNYGPFQFPEKLIPLMILNSLEGKSLPVYGDGQNMRDWIYVDDHCRAIRRVLEGGRIGETYNVGGNCERSNLSVVETICETVDMLRPGLPHAPCRSLISFVKDRPGHDRRYAIDATKIRQELGWQPRQNLEMGLRDTVKWYLSNGKWVERVTSGVYRRERLGLGTAHASR